MVQGVFVGLTTIDIIYPVDEVPAANAKIVARNQQVLAGGPATNAAITFSHLGGNAVVVAPVGRHPISAIAKRELTQRSVRLLDLLPDRDLPPPISSVCVDRQGRRSVVSVNATQTTMPQPQVDPVTLENADIFLVDGHAMEACQAWARAARAQGVPVVFDGGSWKPGTDQLLMNVETAICSADFLPPSCIDHDTVIEFLLGYGIRKIAITRGADPIRYLCNSSPGKIEVPHVNAVDTTGAGDVFHGAFCYFAATGLSFVEALQKAADIAVESCRFHGTRGWMQAESQR